MLWRTNLTMSEAMSTRNFFLIWMPSLYLLGVEKRTLSQVFFYVEHMRRTQYRRAFLSARALVYVQYYRQHFDILSFKMSTSTHTVYSIAVATSHMKDTMAAHLRSVRPLSFNMSICVSLVFSRGSWIHSVVSCRCAKKMGIVLILHAT